MIRRLSVIYDILGPLGLAAAALGAGMHSPTSGRYGVTKLDNAIKDVHDPSIIRQGNTYYLFSTGPGIPIRRSHDLVHWEFIGSVFPDAVPPGARREIPESKTVWAPAVVRLNERYYLYYALSTFGNNRSLIALATNRTLDPESSNYRWEDEGTVIASTRLDNYNAIDPNILVYGGGNPILTFGSFWSGIKSVRLNPATGKPSAGAMLQELAHRPYPDAIEAPFLLKHGKYYYLLVSFDYCCRGTNSTYNIRVGRSSTVDGPYKDRDGKSMLDGGGTLLLATQGQVIGPGHCSVLQDGATDYLVHHFYDGDDHGRPTLQIRRITWAHDGWPIVGEPLLSGSTVDRDR